MTGMLERFGSFITTKRSLKRLALLLYKISSLITARNRHCALIRTPKRRRKLRNIPTRSYFSIKSLPWVQLMQASSLSLSLLDLISRWIWNTHLLSLPQRHSYKWSSTKKMQMKDQRQFLGRKDRPSWYRAKEGCGMILLMAKNSLSKWSAGESLELDKQIKSDWSYLYRRASVMFQNLW